MRIRQEQIVLLLVLLLVAWLGRDLLGFGGGGRAPSRGGDRAPDLERHAAPDLDVVLPAAGAPSGLARALMSKPSDTRPLAPLDFVAPPLGPLPGLAPPAPFGPRARHFERLLTAPLPTLDASDLFEEPDAPPDEFDATDDRLVEVADAGDLDPTERLEREATWKRLYDWVSLNGVDLRFGRVLNEDPYTLKRTARANEALRFEELVPETGLPRFGGSAIVLERERVHSFALADSDENRLEQGLRDLPERLGAAEVPVALALADDALRLRHEVERGLAIAEELYRRTAEFDAEDPRPFLGLGRVYEAGFRFELAFEVYEDLVARLAHRPEGHVALGRLEERFRLFDSARARFERALGLDRGGWRAAQALARLELAVGDPARAVTLLDAANRAAPTAPELKHARVALRCDLGEALTAVGRPADALESWSSAWRAAPEDDRATGGLLATLALLPEAPEGVELPDWAAPGGEPDRALDTDGLLGFGLLRLSQGEAEAAHAALVAAAASDPLRAAPAWRALSWLADAADAPAEAVRYVELALEAAPLDPWTRFQAARLLVESDDFETATALLDGSLEQEPDQAASIALLADMAERRGLYADADRYWARAVELAPDRPDLRLRRGQNRIRVGAFLDARVSLGAARELDPELPEALAGLAWCEYRLGDPEEGLIQLRLLDDTLRARPEEDPLRAWARGQMVRLQEHLEKLVWSDDFERTTLKNGWEVVEGAGPQVSLRDGVVVLSGTFRSSGEARVYREYPAAEFVALEARLWIQPGSNVRAGVHVSREQTRSARGREVQTQVAVALSRDGVAQYRVIATGQSEDAWHDAPEIPFPAGEWVALRIERRGEGSDSTVDVLIDGLPVIENRSISSLGRSNQGVKVGLFVEGEAGRTCEVRMDAVRVVRRVSS